MGRLGEDMELIWGSILPQLILMYGKCMGRKADAINFMGKLWEHNFHMYPIPASHLLALHLLWE